MTSFKGTREAFSAALFDLAAMEGNDKLMFISADSLKAMRATAFAERYPAQYIEVGIAEQCAVATAAGLASCGFIPFVGTYAGFLTMRACEQIRTFVAYPNLNVKFAAINAGLIGGEREGVTHQFYEDIGILSSIPGISIFTPADAAQTYWAVYEAYKTKGPVYIRMGSGREPDIYDRQTEFSPEGVRILRKKGKETVLFVSGFLADRVLAAAELLQAEGISTTVADVNIIHNNQPREIINLIQQAKQIFTIEDHNIHGGLGTYICSLACEYSPVFVHRIGLTKLGESGPAKELADAYGFSPRAIADAVKHHANNERGRS